MARDTSGAFNYQYPADVDRSDTLAERERLRRAAAIEPILLRWRDRCTPGLIDDNGKIRSLFRKAPGEVDNASRVIDELGRVPEAMTEVQAALEAQLALGALERQSVEMPVRDARVLGETSIHDAGFQLVSHESSVANWLDDAELAATYYPEIEAVVRAVTGAKYVFSNNHLRRQSEPEEGGNGPLARYMSQSRGPVQYVHNDFAESYGDGIVRTVASGGVPHTQTFGLTDAILDEGVTADELASSRLLVINTWRSVGAGPLTRFPLALADRRSIPRASLHTACIGRIPSGEPRGGIDIVTAEQSPQHRWYYFPGMTADEVLLWKGYDSAEVPAQPTLHSSFDDPRQPPGAGERLSIEVRVLAVLPG